MMSPTHTRTQVAIVGGGPAGLMLSHLLHLAGIDSVVIDNRTVDVIETTHRAGILEQDSVAMLVNSGVDRVLRDGHRHNGIDLRFNGESHRINFEDLIDAAVWLYPQTDIFIDLYARRSDDGADLRYGIQSSEIFGIDTDQPTVRYVDSDGVVHEIQADLVAGCDGSRSQSRDLIAGHQRFTRTYPFAWFGVMVETPQVNDVLIYNRSERGFALVSQRTETVQRLYFQCDPNEDVKDWSDDRIWNELNLRLAGSDGFELPTGAVLERTVLPFRSFVQTPMQSGRLLIAGDAAHTVPPTGAKGLNLALADVRILAEVIEKALLGKDLSALETYTPRASARVWKAQYFSYWMTTMLHRLPELNEFDEQRQLAELSSLLGSTAGATHLAECYTGWPTLKVEKGH